MNKKIMCFIFVLTFMFNSSIVLYAYEQPSSWAISYISRARQAGLVPESLLTDYSAPITHAEFAALIVAAYESRHDTIMIRLPLINSPNMNVQKAATIGVIDGAGHSLLVDVSPVTREEAALMLSRLAYALGHSNPNTPPEFADSHLISAEALYAVGHMQSSGIMSGVEPGIFAPSSTHTKEQSIVAIIRLLDLVPASGAPATVYVMTASAFEREIFNFTNVHREAYGLQPLVWDYTLAHAARVHSRDMATNNFISHTGSDGSLIDDRLERAGLSGTGWGENINGGINNVYTAVTSWMDSPGNRMNILSPHMTHMGVGFYYEPYSEFVFYTTQKFVRDLSFE